MRGECNTYGGEERHIQDFSGEIREGDNLENSGINGRIILKWIFKEWCGRVAWTGLMCLRIGTGDGLL